MLWENIVELLYSNDTRLLLLRWLSLCKLKKFRLDSQSLPEAEPIARLNVFV